MNTAMSTLSRLFSPRRRAPVVPDPADMGTCFGMEMTLQREPEPLESERIARQAVASAEAAGTTKAAATDPPPAEKRRWRPWAARPARKSPLVA
jgi:hypothetical protein